MATKVLDSWALIAFFEDEPAAEAVEKLLEQATAERHKLLISVVNWGEVYYNTMREVSEAAAEQKLGEIAAMPIEVVGADLPLTKQAAIYKATKKCPTPTALARRWLKSKMPNSSPATRNSRKSKRKSKSTG